ncbi:MAG: hypothetical protein KDC45_04680, partial [Bacteroidetes bacterium]|nr:hypothetical protein [Bacteroidota bacterium]
MNTRKLIKTVVLVAAGLLVSKIISCDLKDDDFSDIQIIQQIIKEDVEDIYGVEKAGDDSLFVTASLAKSLAGSGNSGYGFQRRVTKVERKIDVTIIADTLAEARIQYDVSGTFRVDSNFTTLAGKKFRHRLERYVGFVKRPDTDSLTRRTWRPTGFTPAFGASLNDMGEYRTAMEFDSLLIVTPDFQYEVNDPGDLFTFYRNPIRVKRGDHVSVRIKAINAFDVLDIPVGFLKSG